MPAAHHDTGRPTLGPNATEVVIPDDVHSLGNAGGPCKAPFAYYGGKAGMARRIIDLMPEHRVYIEPFFGSGAVFFAKQPARFEIINDLDDAVVTFFRVLRDQPDELERVCALTPHARAEFAAAQLDDEVLDDLERARRFWVRVNQSFAKTAGVRTGWSITTARTQTIPNSLTSRITRFVSAAERLASTTIEHTDAAALVARLATNDTVIYADPPYLASTRSSRASWGTENSDYRHDMHDEASHRRLAEVLQATPAKVILSGYHSPLYDELYDGWATIEVPVTMHSSNAAGARHTRPGRVEVLWLNYEPHHGHLPFEGAS